MFVVSIPSAEGLSYNVTVENDNISVAVDITVNFDLEVIYNSIVSKLENIGVPAEYIPSLDEVSATVENRLETVENLRNEYRDEIENAMSEICENKIREYVPGVDVEYTKFIFDVTRQGYVFTIDLEIGLDLTGEGLFKATSEGRRRIDLRWRAFAVNQARNVAGKSFDSRWTFMNLSGFQTSLENWQRSDENDRIVLSYTTDYQVELPEYGVAISVDPIATLVGPPGSAGASVTGDEIVLALPTQPYSFLPPLWLVAVALVGLVVAILFVVLKYTSFRKVKTPVALFIEIF